MKLHETVILSAIELTEADLTEINRAIKLQLFKTDRPSSTVWVVANTGRVREAEGFQPSEIERLYPKPIVKGKS